MEEVLLRIFNLSVIQNTIRTSTPLILAALGGLLTMQADILNIGMDGMILIGAFFAVLGSYLFASSLMGVAFAVLSGIIIGLFFSFMVVKLKADEFIVGIAINIFAGGLTVFLLRSIFGVKGAFSSEKIIAELKKRFEDKIGPEVSITVTQQDEIKNETQTHFSKVIVSRLPKR